MNKKEIFQDLHDKLISYNLIYEDENIYFIVDNNDLYLTLKGQENRIKKYIIGLYEDEEKQHIDKRTAKKLLEEFIQLYPHSRIESESIAKIEEEERQLQQEELNKEKLYNIIPELEKFKKFKTNIEVRFFIGLKKYVIEFTCSKDKYHSDTISIYNNNITNKYVLKVNANIKELDHMELIKELENMYNNYIPYYNEQLEEKRQEEEKQLQEIELTKKVFNIRSFLSTNQQVIFKTGKDKFTVFVGNIKYSKGKGSSGKILNYSYTALEKMVKTNKGYFVADKEKDFTIEELKQLNFITV